MTQNTLSDCPHGNLAPSDSDWLALRQGERFDTLLQTGAFRLERILSLGQATAPGQWYDQAQDEWVLLVQGAAQLRIEGMEAALEMRPGDYVLLPAHRRHRVEWTDPHTPTLWLALHYGESPR